MTMTTKNVHLTDEQRVLLKRAARREKATEAELIRRAIDQYLATLSRKS